MTGIQSSPKAYLGCRLSRTFGHAEQVFVDLLLGGSSTDQRILVDVEESVGESLNLRKSKSRRYIDCVGDGWGSAIDIRFDKRSELREVECGNERRPIVNGDLCRIKPVHHRVLSGIIHRRLDSFVVPNNRELVETFEVRLVREFDESVVVIERKWGAEPEYLHCDVKVLLVYVVRGGGDESETIGSGVSDCASKEIDSTKAECFRYCLR